MNIQNNEIVDLEKIKNIQDEFEYSMKILEKSIAESITNKQKIEIMKKDLLEANNKFSEAEQCLNDLKIKLSNVK